MAVITYRNTGAVTTTPVTSDTYDLGSIAATWRRLYLGNQVDSLQFGVNQDTILGRIAANTLGLATGNALRQDLAQFRDGAAPAAPGAGLTSLYATAGRLRYRPGAAGVDTLVPQAHGDLSTIGADDHHLTIHTHASHTSITASDHFPFPNNADMMVEAMLYG